ncbi:MAG TPA: protease complex subunit PrcB family protein [Myxococcaceae bacterium]
MTNVKAILAVALVAAVTACSNQDPDVLHDPNIPSGAQEVTMAPVGGTQVQVPNGNADFTNTYFYSGFKEPARLVIRDQQAWASAWATLMKPNPGASGPPIVDFSSEMVILAAMGERNRGGFGIDMTEAALASDALYVSVLETSPGVSCVTTDAITSPVALTRVARYDGEVKFSENARTTDCR